MTRTIKAKDIKPGMTIEWTDNDWTYSGTISEVLRSGCSQPSMSLRNTGQVWEYVDLDQEVTVLKEAQPEEPTTFGARVVVDGVQFIRRGGGSTYAWEASFGTCFTWDDLLRLGHVTVVPDQGWTDPFSPPAQDATEPRKWTSLADIPETVVSVVDRDGDVVKRLVTAGQAQWVYMAHRYSDIRPTDDAGPFIEVCHNGRLERGEQEKA